MLQCASVGLVHRPGSIVTAAAAAEQDINILRASQLLQHCQQSIWGGQHMALQVLALWCYAAIMMLHAAFAAALLSM